MARLLRPFLRRLTSRPRALHVTRATPLILLYTLQIIAVTRFGARLNRLPAASAGDMVMATGKRHGLACSSTELTLHPCYSQEGKAGSQEEGCVLTVAVSDIELTLHCSI